MAGSLNCILNDDGTFQGLWHPSWGTKTEALAECHQIIAELLETVVKNAAGRQLPGFPGVDWTDKRSVLDLVCLRLGYLPPLSDSNESGNKTIVPVIQPELHGHASVYKPGEPKEWLIYSNEHAAWWGRDRIGYYANIGRAGRYTKAEADAICADANRHLPDTNPNEVAVKAPEAL